MTDPQAFYRQLSAWVLYGQLADPYGEFFVACTDKRRRAPQQDAATAAAAASRSQGLWGAPAVGGAEEDGSAAEWHDAFYVDVRRASLRLLSLRVDCACCASLGSFFASSARSLARSLARARTHHPQQQAPVDQGGMTGEDAGPNCYCRTLPPGVELSVAESVRFTGCAVRVLTSPRGAYAGRALFPESEVQEAAAAVGQLSAAPAFDAAVFASVIESLRSRAVRPRERDIFRRSLPPLAC